MKEKLVKYSKKFIGKVPLIEEKRKIWDQLALEVTKFKSYIEFL